MDVLSQMWDALLEQGAEEQTLQVVTDINGYSEETMCDILYALTGYRNFGQLGYDFDDEYYEDDEDAEEIEGTGLISHLIPTHGQKSFGGKAVIDDQGDWIVLYSYDTPVAQYDKAARLLYIMPNKDYAPNGKYSATTTRHIRAFAEQLGINVGKATVAVYS